MSNKIKKDLGLSTSSPLGNYKKAIKSNNTSSGLTNGVGDAGNITNTPQPNKSQTGSQFANVTGVRDVGSTPKPETKNIGGALKDSFNKISSGFKSNVGNTIVDGYKNIINSYKGNTGAGGNSSLEPEQTPSTTETTTAPTDNYWKEIQSQIKQNSLNSKNEVAMAQRKASQNMDNYLKALGIQNTGLGQSQYASLASDYANAVADINKNEQEQLLDAQGKERAELAEMNDKKAQEAMSLIEAGGSANDVINQLKSEGYDTTFLENYAKTISDNTAKAEAENVKLSNEETLGQGKDMYYALNEKITAGGLSKPQAEELQGILNELGSAITSKDYERVAELYDKAEMSYYGLSSTGSSASSGSAGGNSTGSSASSSLPNGTYSVDTMKPSDFGNFTDRGNYNRQTYALEMLIEDSKKWTQSGENNGMIVDVNWGNGKQYYQFNAQNGTWKKISKDEAKDSGQSLHNLKDMYKSDIKEEHGGAMENIGNNIATGATNAYNWASDKVSDLYKKAYSKYRNR